MSSQHSDLSFIKVVIENFSIYLYLKFFNFQPFSRLVKLEYIHVGLMFPFSHTWKIKQNFCGQNFVIF